MKLKNIIITALASLAIVSCDNIAEDDRVLPVEINATDRVVLLTEFTGMGCVNCPEAASIASDLLDKFFDNFIVVAMHPLGHGFVWDNDKVSPRLGRQEAMDYLQAYGGGVTSTLPSGVVNFTNYGEGYLLGSSVWAANAFAKYR